MYEEKDFEKKFTKMCRIVSAFFLLILTVFLLIIGGTTWYSIRIIEKYGLKKCIERVWNGDTNAPSTNVVEIK